MSLLKKAFLKIFKFVWKPPTRPISLPLSVHAEISTSNLVLHLDMDGSKGHSRMKTQHFHT